MPKSAGLFVRVFLHDFVDVRQVFQEMADYLGVEVNSRAVFHVADRLFRWPGILAGADGGQGILNTSAAATMRPAMGMAAPTRPSG